MNQLFELFLVIFSISSFILIDSKLFYKQNSSLIIRKFNINEILLGFISLILKTYVLIYFAFRYVGIINGEIIGGIDAIVYKTRFEKSIGLNIIASLSIQNNEFGYGIFVWICANVFKNFTIFLIVYYLLLFYILFLISKKVKPSFLNFLLITIFVSMPFVDSENIMRNSLAYYLMLLAYFYLLDSNYKKTILLNVIACTIHISAIFVLPLTILLYLCSKYKTVNKNAFFFLLTLFVALLILLPLLPIVFHNTKYEIYFTSKSVLPYGLILEKIVIFILIYFYGKNIDDKNRKLMLIINIFSFFMLFYQYYIPILYRVNVLLIPLNLITYWVLFSNKKINFSVNTKCLDLVLFSVVFFMYILKVLTSFNSGIDSYGLLPHYYIWNFL